MDFLVWIGSALTLLGLLGILWCASAAARARRDAPDDAALRTRLQRLVAVNLGALGLSTLGLMCVILGLFLG